MQILERYWVMALLLALGCSGRAANGIADSQTIRTSDPPAGGQPLPPTDAEGSYNLIAVGDVASCGTDDDEATSRLVDGIPGTIALLGDNVYNSGSASEYIRCFEPSWGRHKARIKPSAGNHEYYTPQASGYYGYFGSAAGEPSTGYYSYDLGSWHIIVLNSNIARNGTSAQLQWLREDLSENRDKLCTLAYWHHPRFSSADKHGNDASQSEFWNALYAGGADVVLNGHDHSYERFSPQTPTARRDPEKGIREFVVGTGGRSHYGARSREPNSEVFNSQAFGVLEMRLSPQEYAWKFVAVPGQPFTDSGKSACH